MQVTVHRIFTLACYTLRGDKYLDFFLFLQDAKILLKDSDFSFFFFFFLRVYPASTPASSSPAFEKKFFFFFFLIWEDTNYLLPSHFFFKLLLKAKLLQGWSLI